jgi:6-pyruvoyltetrahydropterin/6-carboxytetrahydropterin synthase
VLEVDIESDRLDQNGMVMDFADIRDKVKGWVDEHLDHKMLLCKQDPAVQLLQGLKEPCYVMDENPTAENIAKVIFHEMRKMGLQLGEIRLWETPSSYATYRADR